MTIRHLNATLYSAGLLLTLLVPPRLSAQEQSVTPPVVRFPLYVIRDLGTLGGKYSFSYNLNDAGVISGGSATPTQDGDPSQSVVNAPQTAFAWSHGLMRNLGTLGGGNSTGSATNLLGVSVIDSETSTPDPHGADVCAFGTHLQCLAAASRFGQLAALPPLTGGNNSYALDLNDLGQTVGFSDTGVYDPNCAAASTAGYRFQSVVWGPNGGVRQLSPLGGDTVAFAFGTNNLGQTVGGSGVCGEAAPPPYPAAPHAVLWERDGTVVNLGSLGGPVSIASAINGRGDISGTSATADGSPHPFLWTRQSGTLIELTLPDGFLLGVNPCCKTINDRREIVGFMFDADFNSRAFLWKDGVAADLNTLVQQPSPWMLQSAASINSVGQIAGQGLINGEVHAFLATPCTPQFDSKGCPGNDGH